MTLHVALNRTPKEKKNINCSCENSSEDFTADDMREVQDSKSNYLDSLEDIKCSINKILIEVANNSLDNACTIFFCNKKMNGTNGINSIIVKNFDKNNLDKIAAWLWNNGYYVDVNWFNQPHGNILGSLLIYW